MEAFALIAIMALAQTDGMDPPPAKDSGRLILDLSLGGSWFDDILGEEIDPGAFGSIGIGYEWNVTDTGAVSIELEYSQHTSGSRRPTPVGNGTPTPSNEPRVHRGSTWGIPKSVARRTCLES